MIRKMPAFAISVLVALALPLTALAQDATNSPAVVSNGGSALDKQAPTPSTFGISQVSYIEVPGNAFQPWNSTQTYTSDNFGVGPRWVNTGSGSHDLVAPLRLPSGAKITYLELDFHDTSAINNTYASLFVCDWHSVNCTNHPVAGAGPADCLLAGFLCTGNVFTGTSNTNANLTPDNLTVSNFVNSYTLLAEPGAWDGSEKVDGMIVGYVLQVSPAPAFATFLDVPVSNGQHRFIEALAAAGITAGCGGGNYCPNVAVTRGQMAVFLSVALGLQFN